MDKTKLGGSIQMSRQLTVKYSMMSSPIGPIMIASTPQGVCYVGFGNGDSEKFALLRWCQKWVAMDINSDHLELDEAAHRDVMQQLQEYFEGKRKEFEIPLDIRGTSFQKLVWQQLQNIPYGETRSYKEIAVAMGAPRAVRAIGGANNRNPLPILIPCHRVIGSNGALVGYGGGLDIKEYLLNLEQNRLITKKAR